MVALSHNAQHKVSVSSTVVEALRPVCVCLLCLLWCCTLVETQPTTNNNLIQSDTLCDQTPSTPELCGPVMCHHGKCTRRTYHDREEFVCTCYRGWLRPGCEACCDLPCLNNGTCDGTYRPLSPHHKYCTCPRTHTGDLCEEELCLKACVNGRCEFGAQEQEGGGGVQVCRCKDGFVGDLCELPDPDLLPDWYYPVVGVVVTLGILLVILGVVMLYVMWRRRALIVLKLLYYFKQYKEDDSLRFDVFIACTSDTSGEDMDFLYETLCPVLEDDLGYRVCYGERNFTPGRSLVDNTCVAIEQSRRTILLLSPDFLLDAWPAFQLQIAQHEAIQSAHRIIPVLFRDLGPVDNPTLRHILGSLQCLKWPHGGTPKQTARFWRKLKVLMPKLKDNPQENKPGQQVEFVLQV